MARPDLDKTGVPSLGVPVDLDERWPGAGEVDPAACAAATAHTFVAGTAVEHGARGQGKTPSLELLQGSATLRAAG